MRQKTPSKDNLQPHIYQCCDIKTTKPIDIIQKAETFHKNNIVSSSPLQSNSPSPSNTSTVNTSTLSSYLDTPVKCSGSVTPSSASDASNNSSTSMKWRDYTSEDERLYSESDDDSSDDRKRRPSDISKAFITTATRENNCISSTSNGVSSSTEPTSVTARTVRSKTQLYRATSELLSPIGRLENGTAAMRQRASMGNGEVPSTSSFDVGTKENDSISKQVANIGERVRRSLSFDSEDTVSDGSNSLSCSDNYKSNGSAKRNLPQPKNLLKSLMKRSHPVAAEGGTWSTCKQAKPDDSFDDRGMEVSSSALSSFCSRPDSPNTLLGDAEVALITSSAIRVATTTSSAIDIPTPTEKGGRITPKFVTSRSDVFNCKTGLPLTSSPAPLRKGSSFDYDPTLKSVAAIKR